jgi:hypothetical protein
MESIKSKKEELADAKILAELLFYNTNKEQQEIASIVGVSAKTMSEWVNANDSAWKKNKVSRTITRENIVNGILMQLYNLNLVISKQDGGLASKDQYLAQSRLTKSLEEIDKKPQLGEYMKTVEEFVKFINNQDGQLAGSIALYSIAFINSKSK